MRGSQVQVGVKQTVDPTLGFMYGSEDEGFVSGVRV